MAAKRTSELIPLCHPIALTQVDLSFSIVEEQSRIDIECVTRTEDRTGVEMEALIGASVAATTIYDMCKAVDRGMVIGDIRLLEKTGGKEDYVRPEETEPRPGRPTPSRSRPVRHRPCRPSAGRLRGGGQRQREQGRAQEGRPRGHRCASSTASRATPTPVPGTAR